MCREKRVDAMKGCDCVIGAGLALILVVGAGADTQTSSKRVAEFKAGAASAVARLCGDGSGEARVGRACLGRLLDLAGNAIALAKRF